MQESFYENLRRGDIAAARAIKKRRAPTAEELKRTLFMAVTELEGELQIEVINFLRSETHVDMNAHYENQETIQHVAAKRKKIDAFVFLLFTGAPSRTPDKEGKEPYHYFNSEEAAEVNRLVLTLNQTLRNSPLPEGHVLFDAFKEYLVKKQRSVEVLSQSPSREIKADSRSLFKLLMAGKWNEAEACFARTPLEPSALTQLLFRCVDGFDSDDNLLKSIAFLVERGADCTARHRRDFKMPLHVALGRGKLKTAKFLVSKIKKEDKRQILSRLFVTISEEIKNDELRAKALKFLIEQGVDVSVGRQALSLEKKVEALPMAKPGIVVEPEKAKAILEVLNNFDVSEIVKRLRSAAHNLYKLCAWNCMEYSQYPQVKEAVFKLHEQLQAAWFRLFESHQSKKDVFLHVKSLIWRGAHVDWQDKSGKTMLHYAIEQENKKLMTLLKANNARMDIPTVEGITAQRLEVERNQPRNAAQLMSNQRRAEAAPILRPVPRAVLPERPAPAPLETRKRIPMKKAATE